MSRVALIVNPFASGVSEERVRAVEGALRTAGQVQTAFTARPGHATELARAAAAEGCDAIVAFSGDGGFNEVLNGVDGSLPVGFVPGGGTNVLPRDLGLPRDPVVAARRIADAVTAGRSRRISLGRVNGRRFAFNAAMGFAAEAVRRVDARGRRADGKRPGDLVFVWTLAQMLREHGGRYEPALEVVGLGRAAFLMVANVDPFTYAGSFPIHASHAARFEGGLDVIAPARVAPGSLPRLVAAALGLVSPKHVPDLLTAHDVDRIEAVCDEAMPLQVDGEDLGDVTSALFEAERNAVSVLV
jgi:diacylglycerol kinase family enzyme